MLYQDFSSNNSGQSKNFKINKQNPSRLAELLENKLLFSGIYNEDTKRGSPKNEFRDNIAFKSSRDSVKSQFFFESKKKTNDALNLNNLKDEEYRDTINMLAYYTQRNNTNHLYTKNSLENNAKYISRHEGENHVASDISMNPYSMSSPIKQNLEENNMNKNTVLAEIFQRIDEMNQKYDKILQVYEQQN